MIWLLQRTLSIMLSVWVGVSIVFLMIRVLPGDAVSVNLSNAELTADQIQERRDNLGLNRSVSEQYFSFWWNVARYGDFGVSTSYGLPVTVLIGQQFVSTTQLALGSLVVAVILGLGLGCSSSMSQNTLVRIASGMLISLSISAPIIVTSAFVILIFTSVFNLLPSTGTGSWRHLVLPSFILGYHTAGAIARTTQNSVLNVYNSHFIVAARGRGISGYDILLRHVLKNAAPPVLRIIALQAGFLLGGVVITEAVFARPGLGTLLLNATSQRDYPILQGLVMLSAATYAVISVLADLLHAIIDPRITA